MEKLKRIALVCLIVTQLNYAQSSRYEGSTDCDFTRSSYVQLEKNLWEKYVDKLSSLSRNERLHKIFNQHYMFIQQHMDKSYEDDDFSVLAKFYEWNVIQPDVKSIHVLFKDNFRHRLEMDLESNDVDGGSFDERAGLDLAETILTDPLWPVNSTMEKIQNNIYNQGLYYKAKSVRARSVPCRQCNIISINIIKSFHLTHSRKHQLRFVHRNGRHNKCSTSSTMQLQ